MHQFIHDEAELRRFFDLVVPPLAEGETYFLSLSARDKYLTREERDEFSLGRSEMFERRIIREREWTTFLRTIKKYNCDEGAYTGRTGLPIPAKAMVVYWNTNPTDALRAWGAFNSLMATNTTQLLGNAGSSREFFTRTNQYLMNEFQRQRGTKHYIDYDLDVTPGREIDGHACLVAILALLKDRGVQYFVVKTRGGYHVLMKSSTIGFDYARWFNEFQGPVFSEVKKNENEMIPLPGTVAAGFPIRILWDMSNFEGQGS